MPNNRRAIASLLAIVAALGAECADISAAPDPEVRQVLAPTGKLRVGLYPGSPTSVIGDPASGTAKGVGFDLGRELARRAGIPFEPVVFPKNADVLAALKAGEVDLVLTNATPARAKDMNFTSTVLEIEQGYLVPWGSSIASLAEVDRAGVRVGVSQGSTSESVLSRELRNAAIVTAPTLQRATEMLTAGTLDAFATNKAILFVMADGLPGARVLDGRWGLEQFAFGVPRGREAALAYVGAFARDAKSEGLVTRAVGRAGLRGAVGARAGE